MRGDLALVFADARRRCWSGEIIISSQEVGVGLLRVRAGRTTRDRLQAY
jgi:hypothetical protein